MHHRHSQFTAIHPHVVSDDFISADDGCYAIFSPIDTDCWAISILFSLVFAAAELVRFTACHFFLLLNFVNWIWMLDFQGKIKRILNFWWNELDLKLELNIGLDWIDGVNMKKFESGFCCCSCWTDWFDVGSDRQRIVMQCGQQSNSQLVGWSKVSGEEDGGSRGNGTANIRLFISRKRRKYFKFPSMFKIELRAKQHRRSQIASIMFWI